MRIVGLLVVGAGEADRYLEGTLKEFARLTDEVVVCGNQTDEKTEQLIKQYGFWFYRDDREWGKNQPYIKTDLLRRIGRLKPDWVLPLDADETFTPEVTRSTLEELTKDAVSCYFYIVNFWNDREHYAKALSFWNIRFFKYLPQLGVQYIKKPVHCGLGPPYTYRLGRYVPYIVRHYGLMKQEDRKRKIERYKQYDPEAKYKSAVYYEALGVEASGSQYQEEIILQKVKEEVEKMKQKNHANTIR